ncbi:hypothetical protein TNCV_1348831 [Trichonephila clavipes]|nr:hypothetical protein TNCV_1348831 [Trichonephila clavipes]
MEEQKHTTQKNIDIYITNDDPSIERKGCAAFHSRLESIFGESPTSFPEEASMPYSGFEPEPTRLKAEGHIQHTGWAARKVLKSLIQKKL